MKRANSGLTWIRQKHVTQFLQELAVTPTVTHEVVDALPSSRTREFVRGLLIEHGVLPHRDVYRARYDEWSLHATRRDGRVTVRRRSCGTDHATEIRAGSNYSHVRIEAFRQMG